MDTSDDVKKGPRGHTIQSLRLDVAAAREGKTWLLLPEGHRYQDAGLNYPLPTRRDELQILASIYCPTKNQKNDAGCIYLRRAMDKLKRKEQIIQSAHLDVKARHERVKCEQSVFKKSLRDMKEEAEKALEEVKQKAEVAIASMHELFELGRKGIEAQMKAHIDNGLVHGEKIDAKAFRECFKMVSATVKGLGLPTDQKKPAADAVNREVAASLKATQEALSLAPGKEDVVEH